MKLYKTLHKSSAMQLETKDYKHFKIGTTLIDGFDNVDKALPGDEVEIRDTIVKLVKRKQQPYLVGIIELTSKYKYGYTSRGIPIYIFNPYDESYPSMMVGCSERDVSINRICLVQFDKWDEALPRGILIKLLGPAGDKETELEALYWRYSPWSSPSRNQLTSLETSYSTEDTAPHRDIIDWPFTVNIDPSGCRDIDDIISLKQISDNVWLVAISIADVGEIIKFGSSLDIYARHIGQTLYQDGRQPRHMLPAVISENIGSLIPGKPRKAISLLFKWSPESCDDYRIVETIVTNQHSHTYESILTTTDFPTNILDAISTSLRQKRGLESTHDSHEWIESLMIHYNSYVATKIVEFGGLLRCHEGPNIEKAATMEKLGLGFLGLQSAKYVLSNKNIKHWSLGLDIYCHASSPLRRYADIVNQWAIKSIIRKEKMPVINPDELNKLQRLAKAHDRDLALVNAISKGSCGTTTGTVLDIKHIYIEEWKTVVQFTSNEPPGTHIIIKYFCDMRQRSWKRRIVLSRIKN